jgi:hypothetical protein
MNKSIVDAREAGMAKSSLDKKLLTDILHQRRVEEILLSL